MLSLEAIDRQRMTLERIGSVVRTMKTLSAVNAAPYEAAAVSIDSYYRTVRRALHVVLRDIDLGRLRDAGREGPSVLLVFGSDHGMCGGFNEDAAAVAVHRLASPEFAGPELPIPEPARRVFAVGARCEMALEAAGAGAARTFLPPGSAEGLGRLAGELLIALDDARGRASTISLTAIYNKRTGDERHETVAERLLPVDAALLDEIKRLPWRSNSLPSYSMQTGALFASLVRQYLFVRLYRIAALSMAAENAARLAQMQQAERSIDERLEGLTMAHRTARQSQITDELLDVIGGFEALAD